MYSSPRCSIKRRDDMDDVKIRKLSCKLGEMVFVNEFWTCPACKSESNSVEWWLTGKPIDSGYEVTHRCPRCEHLYVVVV